MCTHTFRWARGVKNSAGARATTGLLALKRTQRASLLYKARGGESSIAPGDSLRETDAGGTARRPPVHFSPKMNEFSHGAAAHLLLLAALLRVPWEKWKPNQWIDRGLLCEPGVERCKNSSAARFSKGPKTRRRERAIQVRAVYPQPHRIVGILHLLRCQRCCRALAPLEDARQHDAPRTFWPGLAWPPPLLKISRCEEWEIEISAGAHTIAGGAFFYLFCSVWRWANPGATLEAIKACAVIWILERLRKWVVPSELFWDLAKIYLTISSTCERLCAIFLRNGLDKWSIELIVGVRWFLIYSLYLCVEHVVWNFDSDRIKTLVGEF